MSTHILPGPGLWDAKKFAVRYNLNALKPDFYVNGEGLLVVFPTLPDDPPIFDLPDPPIPQGVLKWEVSDVPGAVRLVAEYNGKKSAIVGAVGADASLAAMYQSPGPVGPQPAGPRREFHVASPANIGNIPTVVVDGDTLYIENDGEYRRSNGAWRRVLFGPSLGSPADTPALYTALDAAMDTAINPPQGPNIDSRIRAVLIELRKLI